MKLGVMKRNDRCRDQSPVDTPLKRYPRSESYHVSLLPTVCHLRRMTVQNIWCIGGQSTWHQCGLSAVWQQHHAVNFFILDPARLESGASSYIPNVYFFLFIPISKPIMYNLENLSLVKLLYTYSRPTSVASNMSPQRNPRFWLF